MKDWAGVAAAYRDSFARGCAGAVRPLLATTSPAGRPDSTLRHLDVGCGDGLLARTAAASGRAVTACDPDDAMCRMTRDGDPSLHVDVAALPHLPYRDDGFDVVTASFVVNHVADPRTCTAELIRVCAPGGVVGVTIWPAGGPGFGELLAPLFGHPGDITVPSERLPEHLDFERTPAGLATVLRSVGLTDVSCEEITWSWRVSATDLWVGIAAGIATPGKTYRAQSAAVRQRIEADFFTAAAARSVDGTLSFDARAVLGIGSAA